MSTNGTDHAGQEELLAHTHLQSALEGNLDAFNKLVTTYEQRVYNLCYRMLGDPEAAADTTQDAFLNCWRSLARFRGPKDEGELAASFRAWLFRIAANACYDVLRQRKRRPTSSLDQQIELAGEREFASLGFTSLHGDEPEASALRSELSREIQRSLVQLAEDQRLALILCDVQGFSYEEIAVITSSSLGTVKSRISRGRSKMRDLLLERGVRLPTDRQKR